MTFQSWKMNRKNIKINPEKLPLKSKNSEPQTFQFVSATNSTKNIMTSKWNESLCFNVTFGFVFWLLINFTQQKRAKKSVIKLKICFWLYFQFMISLQYFYAYFSCSSMNKIKTIKKSSTCPYYYDFLIWWKTRRAPKYQIYLR